MENDPCPVEIEVSRSTIWENARDLLIVRVRNLEPVATTCTIEIRSDLTGEQDFEVMSLAGGRESEIRVDTRPTARGTYGIRLRVSIEDGSNYLGHFDRLVSFQNAINIGPSNSGEGGLVVQNASINVNIDSGDHVGSSSPQRAFEYVNLVTDWAAHKPDFAVLEHQSGERLTITCPECLTFGRNPELAHVIASSQNVSGKHCELGIDLGKLWLRHTNTSNATFVDDIQVFDGTPSDVTLEQDVSLRLAGNSWTGILRTLPGGDRAAGVATWLRKERAAAPRPSELKIGAVVVHPTSEPDTLRGPVLWLRSVIDLQDVAGIASTRGPAMFAACGGLLSIRLDDKGFPCGATPLRAGSLLGGTWTVVKTW